MDNERRKTAESKRDDSTHIKPEIESVKSQVYGQAHNPPCDARFPNISYLYELPPSVEGEVVRSKARVEPPLEGCPIEPVYFFGVALVPKYDVCDGESKRR